MKQTVQKSEQIYIHKMCLLTENTILIVTKSKTYSVEETCIQSVDKAVEANRQRLLFILKGTLFMTGRIFLFFIRDDANYHS